MYQKLYFSFYKISLHTCGAQFFLASPNSAKKHINVVEQILNNKVKTAKQPLEKNVH